MTDYTKQVIAYHKKLRNIDEEKCRMMTIPLIRCYEVKDWVKRLINEYRIDDLIIDYVDFAQMLLDDEDITIYVRREKEIQSYYAWMNEKDCVWKGREKECLTFAPRNSVFIVMGGEQQSDSE